MNDLTAHEEEYKGYRIRIEYDDRPLNPFEDWGWPEGLHIVDKDPKTIELLPGGDMDADEFDCMVNNYQEFVDSQYGYDTVTRKSNKGKWYTFEIGMQSLARQAYERGGFDTEMESIEAFARANDIPVASDFYWLPIFKYQHSGVRYNTTGFSCPWDSGKFGYIYISKEAGAAEGWKDTESAEGYLDGVVETLSQWASGDVYGFIIEKKISCSCGEHEEWEEVDSCWGFFGDMDYCLTEAKDIVDYRTREEVNE